MCGPTQPSLLTALLRGQSHHKTLPPYLCVCVRVGVCVCACVCVRVNTSLPMAMEDINNHSYLKQQKCLNIPGPGHYAISISHTLSGGHSLSEAMRYTVHHSHTHTHREELIYATANSAHCIVVYTVVNTETPGEARGPGGRGGGCFVSVTHTHIRSKEQRASINQEARCVFL